MNQSLQIFDKLLIAIGIFALVNGNLIAEEAGAKLPQTLAHSAAAYDGDDTIYLFGGYQEDSFPDYVSNQIHSYSISNDTIITLATSLPKGLMYGSLTTDGQNNFYYLGGYDASQESRSVFKFSGENYTISEIAQLPESVIQPTNFNFNSSTSYIFGGGYIPTGIYKFDSESSNLSNVADMPHDFDQVVVFWDPIFGFAYIFGSRRTDGDDPAEIRPRPIIVFNPTNNQVGTIDLEFAAISDPSRSVCDVRYCYAIGGFAPYDSIMRFDPVTFEVEYIPVVNHPGGGVDGQTQFWGTSAVYVEKLRRIYFFGGFSYGTSRSAFHDQIWFIELPQDRGMSKKH